MENINWTTVVTGVVVVIGIALGIWWLRQLIAYLRPFIHPELRHGEMFFSNICVAEGDLEDLKWFHDLSYTTKRIGEHAYYKSGALIPLEENIRPVFIQINEYHEYLKKKK
jgi:hypothetical protein